MKKLLLFALTALLFSCSSDDDSPNNNPINPDVELTANTYYVRGKMNNVPFDYTANNSANDLFLYTAIGGYHGLGDNSWFYYGGSLMSLNQPDYVPAFFIAWDNMYFESGQANGENAAFFETLSTLPTNYLTEAQNDDHIKGFEITFINENGTAYSTLYGNQTGSTLSISGSTEGTIQGLKYKKVLGTFSSKLYNRDDSSDVIVVTNGTFKIMMGANN